MKQTTVEIIMGVSVFLIAYYDISYMNLYTFSLLIIGVAYVAYKESIKPR